MVSMSATGPKKKAGRPKDPIGAKRNVIAMRGTEEWRDWLNELADASRLPATILIDHALMEFAKNHGFKKPMPKR
jgi:hypothetical protein